METPLANQSSRIPSLDGLRALAIIVVVVGHLSHRTGTWISNFPDFGGIGVQLFFVISGFIITHNLIKEKLKTGNTNLINFWTRRFFRLFPAFFAFMIAIGPICLNSSMHLDFYSYILAFFLLSAVAPFPMSWYIGHTWSLSVEQFFYFLWPTLFKFGFGFRFLIFSVFAWPFVNLVYYFFSEIQDSLPSNSAPCL